MTNLEIKRYYADDPRLKGVYSRNNPTKAIKDGDYVVNLDEHKSIGTHSIALHLNGNSVTDFGSFGIEHIPEKVKKFIGNKNINFLRIHAYDSIMCGYFCIGCINFIFKGKTLVDYTNSFSPQNFKKIDIGILNYFLK